MVGRADRGPDLLERSVAQRCPHLPPRLVPGDRHRRSANQTYIEPQVSYSFASGWYVQCDPALTYDWTADSADAWSIPMGADIGDALTIGAQAMTFQLGVYDFLKRPDGGAEWLMRAQVTLLFPAG